VQRLFSMFPLGAPGVALLLLRISVAGIFIFRLSTWFTTLLPHWVFFGAAILAAFVGIGFLTPILAALFALFELLTPLITSQTDMARLIFDVLIACALALLGPGAYSVDAWLYGRRVVTVPSLKRPHGS
jgi:hypothetical protein